jgi:hypothetical protein
MSSLPDRKTRDALRLYESALAILAVADVYTEAAELAAEWLDNGDPHHELMRGLLLRMARDGSAHG